MKIAIDGTAASGKGLISSIISKTYNIDCLDTGRLYRACGMFVSLKQNPGEFVKGLELEEEEKISLVQAFIKNIKHEDLKNAELNTEQIGNYASQVAKIKKVRGLLLSFQKNFISARTKVIVEGRDIGSFIMPEADIKLYVDANIEVRAARRVAQLLNKNPKDVQKSEVSDMILKLKERDKLDKSRETNPLIICKDAIVIDNTSLTLEELKDKITSIVNKFTAKES